MQRDPAETTNPPRGVVVVGATGGIGHALSQVISERYPTVVVARLARAPERLAGLAAATHDLACDIGSEASIRDAVAGLPTDFPIDWVLIATGWLHGSDRMPEKTYRSLDAEHLLTSYRVNAVGPALLLKHLLPRMQTSHPWRVGILSARVGSISDNRRGGWHAYRASKAALNMLIKNYAIEMARKNERFIIVGLQPGTTETALSTPFLRSVPPGQLQSPRFTAEHLVDVVARLRSEDSGGLFDFRGNPFDP